MRKDLKECVIKKEEIVKKVSKIPCVFLDQDGKVLLVDEIIKEFSLLVTIEVDREDFSLSSIDKLVDLQFVLDFLDTILRKNKKCSIDLEDSITRVKIITSNTQGPDGIQTKHAIYKFKEF